MRNAASEACQLPAAVDTRRVRVENQSLIFEVFIINPV
jgi:hypothetical protein